MRSRSNLTIHLPKQEDELYHKAKVEAMMTAEEEFWRDKLTPEEFEEMLFKYPELFDAHIMGMQRRIDEINDLYHEYLTSEDEDVSSLTKKLDHWRRTTTTMVSDLNELINKYKDKLKSKHDILDEKFDIFSR